jgi:hypothetical protein
MKFYLMFLIMICLTSGSFAQWFLPDDVEMSLNRIETAFRNGNPGAIEDLIPSGITMRLDDSLYESISSITAMKALSDYFADKDSIQFQFALPGNGQMIFYKNGKKETEEVDVWLRRRDGFPEIYALNISNYPIATIFFRIHHKGKEKS